MIRLLDVSLMVALLAMLMTLGSSRIVLCIRLLAVQGMVLSLLPLAVSDDTRLRVWPLVIGTLVIKGTLVPWFLHRTRRQADVPREVEPYVGFGASILIGVAILAIGFWMASLLPLPHQPPSSLAVPVSFFAIFCGLFLIVSRHKALMQVIGYVTMENGIYIFGVVFAGHQPWIVEMGVLLDLIVAVFVMGIAVFHISREFDHIDVDRLRLLQDTVDERNVAR